MPTSAAPEDRDSPVLLTGATGYVGGRLLRALEAAGQRVRCLSRRPWALEGRVAPTTEIVEADVLDGKSLRGAMDGVRAAFYMVHSMGSTGDFEEQDRRAARNFAEEASRAGVGRIVYLGGLGDGSEELSPHLRSRREVADILRESGVQVLEFRASVVIGSGSLSFEMIRSLVERLPLMVTPKWVKVTAQPIAIADLLQYLSAALDLETDANEVFEIGGPDCVSYGDLMREYARQRRLRRLMVPVPLLTPRLSSLWLGLVTPVYARVGRKLIDSIRHPTVVRGDAARRAFPHIQPQGVGEAIAGALRNEDLDFAETRWSDALASSGGLRDWGGVRFGSRLVDSRTVRVDCPPAAAFGPVERIGGSTGWYYGNWLWRLRGLVDLAAGGVGMRRGRRHPETLAVGDALDCWRVEAIEPGRRLRLMAEMKLPGRAWLEFEVQGDSESSTIRQTAIFDPVGLLGLAYWYAVWPLHRLVFSGMLKGIADAVPRPEADGSPEAPTACEPALHPFKPIETSSRRPREERAEVRSLRMRYLDWGGDGQPVLALHGLASSAHWYDLLAPELRARFRIIAPDQRGHGRTTQAPEGYDGPSIAADAVGLLDVLDIEQAILFGHSWGGNVAVAAAVHFPERVRALVLIDGGFVAPKMMPGATWEDFSHTFRPRDVSGTRAEFLARISGQLSVCWNREVERIVQTMVHDRGGRTHDILRPGNHAQILRAVWDDPVTDAWPRLRCPTLMVAARPPAEEAPTDFGLMRERMMDLAERTIPKGRVHWIPDTIHDVGWHKPRELAGVIVEFLEAV